jgi:hypothetical protein
MESVNVTEYFGFKPLEFASYYCSVHGVIGGCKHLISIDIHVSILPPTPHPHFKEFARLQVGKLRTHSRAPLLLPCQHADGGIRPEHSNMRPSATGEDSQRTLRKLIIQGDQKVSVHLMITVQKHAKIFLNSFNHLP